MSADTHHELLMCFIEYCNNQAKFENNGPDRTAYIASTALIKVGKLLRKRRKEIISKRQYRKAARNGKHGRPTTDTTNTEY